MTPPDPPAAPDDLVTLVGQVHRRLRAHRATVATAESLTGGRLAGALTDLAGSSTTFRGGVVSYATDLKATLLGVPPALLRRHGAVHPEVAAAMARGAQERLKATYGVATTGVAGPDPQDGRPPGEVHLAVAGPGAGRFGVMVESVVLDGDRAAVRAATVRRALELLLDALGNSDL